MCCTARPIDARPARIRARRSIPARAERSSGRRCTASSWSAAARRGWSSSPGSAIALAGAAGIHHAGRMCPDPSLEATVCTRWQRAAIDPGEYEVNYLAQAHWHGFRFRFGEMVGLDRDQKGSASRRHVRRRRARDHAVALDRLRHAGDRDRQRHQRFRDAWRCRICGAAGDPGAGGTLQPSPVNACLRAQTQTGPVRPGQLHVAIVGAGATGTELAAELHRTIREVDRLRARSHRPGARHPHRPDRGRGPRSCPGLPERISEATHRLLDEIGVEVHTGARVTEVTAEGLKLADGSFIASELVVWAAGVKAPGSCASSTGWRPIASISSSSSRHCRRRAIPTFSRSAIAPPVRVQASHAGAAAGAGRAPGGVAHGSPDRAPAARHSRCVPTSIATSARWFRSANGARSGT